MSSSTYSADLSYIHNAGFGNFSEQAGKHILSILKRKNIHHCHVTDLGCGSGIWAGLLTKNGYTVTGIDLSSAMIGIAKKRAPNAAFVTGSFYSAPLPQSKVITSLGECFNYLFDDSLKNKNALQRLFQRCFIALEPGGLFIFDLLVWKKHLYVPYKNFTQGKDWIVLVEVSVDAKSRTLTRTITSFRKKKSGYRRMDEIHHAQLYDASRILQWLRQAGFSAVVQSSYGKLKLRPGHVSFIARKGGVA